PHGLTRCTGVALKRLGGKHHIHDRNLSHRRRVLRVRLLALALMVAPALVAVPLIRSAGSHAQPVVYRPVFRWSPNVSENLALLAGEAPRYAVDWQSRRPVSNYSLVPGGIETPAQLQAAIVTDPQLASHFAGFQFKKARIVMLNRPQLVYLSYRENDAIYWTRTRHL